MRAVSIAAGGTRHAVAVGRADGQRTRRAGVHSCESRRRLRLHGITVEQAPGYIGEEPGYLAG